MIFVNMATALACTILPFSVLDMIYFGMVQWHKKPSTLDVCGLWMVTLVVAFTLVDRRRKA